VTSAPPRPRRTPPQQGTVRRGVACPAISASAWKNGLLAGHPKQQRRHGCHGAGPTRIGKNASSGRTEVRAAGLHQASSRAVRSVLGPIRRVLGTGTIDPELLSAAERLQCKGYFCRREESRTIRTMTLKGTSIKGMVRSTGRSRKLVRDVCSATPRTRSSAAEPAASNHGSPHSRWRIRRLPQWGGTLASATGPRLWRQPAGGGRVGHPPATQRTCWRRHREPVAPGADHRPHDADRPRPPFVERRGDGGRHRALYQR
jgi:hypothetical protein